jgi:hypothetical protein
MKHAAPPPAPAPSPPLLLAQARLHPTDEADLRWYWCDAPGEMGERSSLGPMTDRLAEGRVTAPQAGTPDLPARAFFAARRARPIEARLRRLSAVHQVTLRAAYGPGLPASQLADYPGLGSDALPATLLLLVAQRTGVPRADVRQWCGNAKDVASAAAHRARLAALRFEATLQLTSAGLAYSDLIRAEHRAARRPHEDADEETP